MKKQMREIEEKIKTYFFRENKIKTLTNITTDLQNQILDINEKIKDLSCVDFDKIDIKSPSFESIGSNINNSNYIENNIIKQIEQKENLINKINSDIENYQNEIEVLKIENTKMKNIIGLLDDFYKEILFLKYSQNKSELEISQILKLSISHYHREKKKILNNIYNLMVMYNEI